MPSFTSKPRKMRDALVTLISGIQYNSEQAFQLVTGDPSIDPDVEPYALVFPGEMTSSRAQTAQQDRVVNFELMILLAMEDGDRTQNQTYNYMYDLTDLVMSTLEEADQHDQLNTIDSSLGTWMMDVSRSSFIPAESKLGTTLMCTINIAITYSIDL